MNMPMIARGFPDGFPEVKRGLAWTKVAQKIQNRTRRLVPDNVPLGHGILMEVKGREYVVSHISEETGETEVLKFFSKFFIAHPDTVLKLSPRLPSEARRKIIGPVQANYPLVEIIRLLPDHQVVTLTTFGIKELNDALWQAFANRLLAAFWSEVSRQFKISSFAFSEESSRFVRKNYKHQTVSIPKTAQAKDFLFSVRNRSQAIDKAIFLIRWYIGEYEYANGLAKWTVEQKIRKHFDFLVGAASLPPVPVSDMQKLQGFHDAEKRARIRTGSDEITVSDQDEKSMFEWSKEAITIRQEIFGKYGQRKFTFQSKEYPVIQQRNGAPEISRVLLRAIKKYWVSSILPSELWDLTNEYFRTLSSRFDFIAPALDLNKDFEKAHMIDGKVRDGIIDAGSFLHNYKQTLTKEAFYASCEGKAGLCVFLDIKDMGLLNLESFAKTAELIAASGDGSHALTTGMDVTERFVKTVKSILEKYWKAKITLWGDEMCLFFENATDYEAILRDITKSLEKYSLQGRLTSEYTHSAYPEEIYSKLDKNTRANKFFEEMFRKHSDSDTENSYVSLHVQSDFPDAFQKWKNDRKFIAFIQQVVRGLESGETHFETFVETEYSKKLGLAKYKKKLGIRASFFEGTLDISFADR